MSTDPFPTTPTAGRDIVPRVGARSVGLAVAAVTLHLLMLSWVDGHIGMSTLRNRDHVIIAAIHPVPPPAQLAQPDPKPADRPTPKPRPRSKPAPAANPSTEHFSPVAPDSSLSTAFASLAEIPDLGGSPEPIAPPVEPAVPEVPAPTVAAAPAEARYKVDPPPSAELSYDVQALRQDQTLYGRGKLSWQSEGNRYIAGGEAGVLFITLLTFQSEGMIDEFGVAPVIYREKGFNKSATNTHFHRERNTISFSASETSYPRKGGEQDRTSIIWQLVGIGRGDGAKFKSGGEFNVFVAGIRDGETWRIQIVGQEEIETGAGKVNTWHVARVPQPGSYDRKIDIWLAPQQEWYPVKVRYTEKNGDYIDMSLSNVNFSAAR